MALNHLALNIVNQDPSKGSKRGKFRRAGWDDSFLFKLLVQIRNAKAPLVENTHLFRIAGPGYTAALYQRSLV